MMNLLIVEDSMKMRRMLKELLADLPIRISLAADALAAEQQAEQKRPELVLMDILLPERDGIALTRQFLEAGWTEHIYMVTQCREHHYRDAASAAGAEKYFLKDNLLAVREAVLEIVTTRGEASEQQSA